MTAVLAAVIGDATDDELRAARRLAHRVAASRRLIADQRDYQPVTTPGYPRLLAAFCVEVDAELASRGSPLPGCQSCRRDVGLVTADAAVAVGVGGSL